MPPLGGSEEDADESSTNREEKKEHRGIAAGFSQAEVQKTREARLLKEVVLNLAPIRSRGKSHVKKLYTMLQDRLAKRSQL